MSFQQFAAMLKVGYAGLNYGVIGMTPERYHFLQSRNYDAHECLKFAECPEPRARLGYYYANLGQSLHV